MDPLGIAIWCITQTFFLNGKAFYNKPTREYEFLSANKQVYLKIEESFLNDHAWEVAKVHRIKRGITASGEMHYWFGKGGNNKIIDFAEKLIERKPLILPDPKSLGSSQAKALNTDFLDTY